MTTFADGNVLSAADMNLHEARIAALEAFDATNEARIAALEAFDASAPWTRLFSTSFGFNAHRLTTNGLTLVDANVLFLPDNSTVTYRVCVTARQIGGSVGTVGASASWDVLALLRRAQGAATTELLAGGGASIAPTLSEAATAAWRLIVTSESTYGSVYIGGVGILNRNIFWSARVLAVAA